MATAKEKKVLEARSYLEVWKEQILSPSSLLEFRTDYGTGITDYVSVHLYYVDDSGKGALADLTYIVGKACGYSFNERRHKLALGGGGYSKSYDVALAMFRALGLERETINYRY